MLTCQKCRNVSVFLVYAIIIISSCISFYHAWSNQSMNQNVRKITDGAMMAAIIGVLLLINRQTAGLLENMLLFAFPLPMVFYGARYGWKNSWMLFTAVMILTFIIGTPTTWFYVATESLIGMVYGCGIYHHVSTQKIVIRTLILAVIVNVISILILSSFFGFDINGEVQAYEDAFNKALSAAGRSVPANMNLHNMLRTMIVVATVFTGIFEGLATHLLSRLLLKRLHFPLEPIKPLSEYFPPKWSGYAGLACFVGYYYSVYRPLTNDLAQSILQGFGMAGTIYLALFGMIAFYSAFAQRMHAKAAAVILSLLLFMFFSPAMAITGFLYITTDLHMRSLKGDGNHAQENL